MLAVGGLAAACSDGGSDASPAASTAAPTDPTTTPPATPATPATTPVTTATTGSPAAHFVSTGPTNRDRVALTFHTNGDLDLVR